MQKRLGRIEQLLGMPPKFSSLLFLSISQCVGKIPGQSDHESETCFASTLKLGIFGIADECSGDQVTFLLPKEITLKKDLIFCWIDGHGISLQTRRTGGRIPQVR